MADVHANGVRFNVVQLGHHRRDRTPDPNREPSNDPRAGRVPLCVVMLHGMVMDNLSSLYYTLANPVAVEHDVLLFDQRGHGRSERPPTGYTVADSVADLIAILDTLGHTEPVVLLGNSYGGTVALECAIAHPERVAGLVLIEAHFAVEGWGHHMAGSLAVAAFGLDDEQVKHWLAEQGGRKLNRMARNAESLFYDTTLLDDLQRVEPLTEAQLRSVGCPTLCLYGEHSDILDRARDLRRLVPGAELVVMPDFTHSILLEGTAELKAAILAWLDRVDRDPARRGAAAEEGPT